VADTGTTEALDAEAPETGALSGSELLNGEEASQLLSRAPGRLVLLLGERGSGKTTICAELYERQRRPGSAARFAGSWTLLALEQLAARRRATGEVASADRDTVDPAGRELLHLALAQEDPLHLFLADIPGEVFRRLADNQIDATEIRWLPRADKVVLLVDGARLCDEGARSTAIVRARQLLERIGPLGLPATETRLALLVTKWDLVAGDRAALEYWSPREQELLADVRALDPQAPALRMWVGGSEDGIAALRAWLLEVPDKSIPEPVVSWTEPLAVAQPPAAQPPAAQPTAGQPPAAQPPAVQPTAGQPPAAQPTAGQPPAAQATETSPDDTETPAATPPRRRRRWLPWSWRR
jgi:hypothetical protein